MGLVNQDISCVSTREQEPCKILSRCAIGTPLALAHSVRKGKWGLPGSSLEVYEELVSVPDYRPRVVQKTSGDFGCNFRKTIVYPARPDNNPVAR
jgi:hypothetical protein